MRYMYFSDYKNLQQFFFDKCILFALLDLSICRQLRMTTTLAGLKTVVFYGCSVFFWCIIIPEKKFNFTVVPDIN